MGHLANEHFVRVGFGRSWRRSAFLEDDTHLMAEFPEDSPITGPAQEEFQEFLTRIYGGGDSRADTVLSMDVSYLGRFLDERLSVNVGFFFSSLSVRDFRMITRIVPDERGLPDLDLSSAMFSEGSETVEVF